MSLCASQISKYNAVKELLFSIRSSSSCLPLLPRRLFPSIFPLIMCLRRQFLRQVWPVQLAFLHFIVYRMFLSSLTSCNTSFLSRSVQTIFCILPQYYISALSVYISKHYLGQSFAFSVLIRSDDGRNEWLLSLPVYLLRWSIELESLFLQRMSENPIRSMYHRDRLHVLSSDVWWILNMSFL